MSLSFSVRRFARFGIPLMLSCLFAAQASAVPMTYTFSASPLASGPAAGNTLTISFNADFDSVANGTGSTDLSLVSTWLATDEITSVTNLDNRYVARLLVEKNSVGGLARLDFLLFHAFAGVGELLGVNAIFDPGVGTFASADYCTRFSSLGCRRFDKATAVSGATFAVNPIVSVVEPVTFGMLGIGLIALVFKRRRFIASA